MREKEAIKKGKTHICLVKGVIFNTNSLFPFSQHTCGFGKVVGKICCQMSIHVKPNNAHTWVWIIP